MRQPRTLLIWCGIASAGLLLSGATARSLVSMPGLTILVFVLVGSQVPPSLRAISAERKASYGPLIGVYTTLVSAAGLAWGILGVFATTHELGPVSEFAKSQGYLGGSLLLGVLVVGIVGPLLKQDLPEGLNSGPLVDGRGMVHSHPPPVCSADGSVSEGSSRPSGPGAEEA